MKRPLRRPSGSRVRLSDAAHKCVDVLESRLLLSATTISYPSGFSSAYDIQLNPAGGAAPTITAGGELQLLDGQTKNLGTSAYDLTPQGVSTFDTTFNFDLGTANPDADGFAFVMQNDPAGTSKVGGSAGYLGYGDVQHSVAVKFDFWDNTPANAVGGAKTGNATYTASGVYTNGELAGDDPRQALSTTAAPLHTSVDFSKNPDLTDTGLDFHLNKGDQFQVHLAYDGTTLTETLTDLTLSKSATETYAIDIPAVVGSNTAYVGFVAGQGGAYSTPQISSWIYSGNAASTAIALPAPTLSGHPGLPGSADLSWTENTTLPVTGYEVDQVNGASTTKIVTLGNVTNYEVTGLNTGQSYAFEVKALGDGTNSADSPLSNSVTVSAAGQAPTLAAWSVLPGQITVKWNAPFNVPNGLRLDASTDGGATFTKMATFGPAAGRYTFTGLDVSKTYQLKLTALGNGTTTQDSPTSNVVSVSGTGSAFGPINFPSFPTAAGLVLNGNGNGMATVTGPTGTPANALELTHANPAGREAASAFAASLAGIDTFDTTFQWTYGTQHAPAADGFTFAIVNDPSALGGSSGSMGYGGIGKSFAVAFNLYNNVSQTGIATGGGNPKANLQDLTKNADGSATGIDFHANPGDTFQAHLTYDGSTLTETVTDQTLLAQGQPATFTTSYVVDIPTALGGHSGFVGFTGGTGGAFSQQDVLDWTYSGTSSQSLPAPTAVATSCTPGVADVSWIDNMTAGGFEVDQSTDGVNFTPVASNLPASADSYEVTGLTPGATYYFHVKSTAIGSAPAQVSNDAMVTVASAMPGPIDYSNGFSYDGNLEFNGPTVSITSGNALQLSNNLATDEATSAFTMSPRNITGFDTTFDFTYVPPQTATQGDGFAFVIQNSPDGAAAVGGNGGGLGYGPDNNANGNTGGILNSVAIKFDVYSNNGEGTDSTGLFTNGNAPTLPVRTDAADTSVDMTASGVQLGTTDTYRAHLTYDGATLHEVVTDVTTGKSFSHDYAINLTQYIKGDCAYVGFTAGTGGSTIEQDINTWTFTSVPVQPSQDSIVGTSGNDAITLKQDTDHQHIDWTLGAQSGKVLIADANGLTINGNGGSDTITLDPSNGSPLPNKLVLNSTGSFTLSGFSTLGTGQTIDISKGTTLNLPTGGSVTLASVQGLLKSGSIKSTDAANSGGKLAVADTLSGSNVTLKDALIGDVNQDGTVAFADLLALAQHYGQSGADWSKGDLNYDGTVGFADLLALAQHYGQSTAAVATPAAAAAASPMLAASSNDLLVKKSRKNA